MQEIYAKTCGPMLKDYLDIQQLTIAYHRPKNLRDLLMFSKLKPCQGIENQVETYLQEAQLEDCIEEINYDDTREEEINQEQHHLNVEVHRINKLAKPINKKLIYNPYTKKHRWTNLPRNSTT